MILEATLAITTLAASYAAYRFRQDAKGYYDALDQSQRVCSKCGKFASKKAERTAQLAAYVAGQA